MIQAMLNWFLAAISAILTMVCLQPHGLTPRLLEKHLGIKLPESAVIENYTYSHLYYNNLYVKLSVDKDDLDLAKSTLTDYCQSNNYGSDVKLIPYFENTADWWDMDKDEIEFAFWQVKTGKRAKSLWSYMFMAKGPDGETYFYFSLHFDEPLGCRPQKTCGLQWPIRAQS